MSRYVYSPEKARRFKEKWPRVKREVFLRRSEFPTRKEYQKELTHQRYLLWRRVEWELSETIGNYRK